MNQNYRKNIAIIIQARMGSKRLPGKSCMIVNGKKIIEWVLSTCKSVRGINRVILATSEESNCDILEDIARKEEIDFIRGSESDVLSRFIDAINKFKVEIVIRITADDICHDPEFIEYGLKTFQEENCDYLISHTSKFPLIDGLIYEIFYSDLLLKVAKKDNLSDKDREHVTSYIRDKKINYRQGYLDFKKIPLIYRDSSKFKLCIDIIQDYDKISSAWETKSSLKGIEIGDTKKIISNLQL